MKQLIGGERELDIHNICLGMAFKNVVLGNNFLLSLGIICRIIIEDTDVYT